MNDLKRLAYLAADLPETDLADLIDLAEALHRQNHRKCLCAGMVLRMALTDLDVRFCRIEALAKQIDQLSLDGDRFLLGAAMMLADEVKSFRAMLDELDI